FAQTILQVTLVRKMQAAFATRREDDEARRARADLRDVLDAQARASAFDGRGCGWRAWRGDGAGEEVVELRSRDAQVARLACVNGERQDARHALASQSGDEDDRRVVEELHLVAQVALEGGGRARLLVRHGVPLVDGDDDRATGFDRVARDVRVERGYTFRRINHDDRHVRTLKTAPRHHDRQLLRHLLRLALAPDPCRVNQTK